MIGRYVRFASLAFAVFSAIYWLSVAVIVQILSAIGEQTEVSAGAEWAAQAVPTIVYGLACVLFCHWFAKGIVRRIDIKGPFE